MILKGLPKSEQIYAPNLNISHLMAGGREKVIGITSERVGKRRKHDISQ